MKTRFILIQTSHAGNVGATARAMKVMGFTDLVLVAPRWANVLRREETIQRSSGALDVLGNARVVETPTLPRSLPTMPMTPTSAWRFCLAPSATACATKTCIAATLA